MSRVEELIGKYESVYGKQNFESNAYEHLAAGSAAAEAIFAQFRSKEDLDAWLKGHESPEKFASIVFKSEDQLCTELKTAVFCEVFDDRRNESFQ